MDIDNEIRFVRDNIDRLDEMATGYVPKSYTLDRKQWDVFKAGEYKKATLKGLDYWDEQEMEYRLKYLNGIGGYAQQALHEQFWQDNLYNVYAMAANKVDPGREAAEAHREAMRQLRRKEGDMSPFDANIHCWGCGLFMHKYDEKNNKRHEDDEVCTCSSSRHLQSQMKKRRTAYRKHLEERKKRKAAKEARRAR